MRHKQQTLSVHVPALVAPPAVTVSDALTEQPFIEATLLRPTPRRVRPSRYTVRYRLFVVNAALACLILAYAVHIIGAPLYFTDLASFLVKIGFVISAPLLVDAVLSSRQARLLRYGVAVIGTVVAMPSKEELPTKLTYTFRTLDGAEQTRSVLIALSLASQFALGEPVTILYNPARPDENSPYKLLNGMIIE